jgi:GTP-binding protein EngB required for normal cell division
MQLYTYVLYRHYFVILDDYGYVKEEGTEKIRISTVLKEYIRKRTFILSCIVKQ